MVKELIRRPQYQQTEEPILCAELKALLRLLLSSQPWMPPTFLMPLCLSLLLVPSSFVDRVSLCSPGAHDPSVVMQLLPACVCFHLFSCVPHLTIPLLLNTAWRLHLWKPLFQFLDPDLETTSQETNHW